MKAISLQNTVRLYAKGICLYLMLMFSKSNLAQAIFIIMKNGKSIGKMEVYQHETTNGMWYALKGSMTMNAIVTIHVVIHQVNFFDHSNKLIEASYSRTVNTSSSKTTAVKAVPGGYTLMENDNRNNHLNGGIEFSTLQLYFTEPLHVKAIFSENHLQNLPLTCIGEGVYKLRQPDGYCTTYWFKYGKLQKVEGQSRFGKVTFIRS